MDSARAWPLETIGNAETTSSETAPAKNSHALKSGFRRAHATARRNASFDKRGTGNGSSYCERMAINGENRSRESMNGSDGSNTNAMTIISDITMNVINKK